MTGSDLHPDDVALLTRLGALVDVVDPVPESLVAMGKGLFAFRDPDAALMEIVDTGAPEHAVRGAAGAAGAVGAVGWTSRVHFFELDDVSLDIELTVTHLFCDVLGAVVAPAGGPVPAGWSVVVETVSARYSAPVEPDGRFAVDRVPLGMIRFRLEREGSEPVTTPWVDAR